MKIERKRVFDIIWLENIKIAFQSIFSNKMRSLLTMLGIIIGIGSVIAIVSIGDSMKSVMDDIYKDIGKNRAYLYIGNIDDTRSTDFFYMDDIDIIKEKFSEKISYICLSSGYQSDVTINRNKVKLSLTGIDAGFEKVQNIKMLYGRMINQSDIDRKSKCVVLEKNAAIKLFGRDNVIGETIRVKLDYNIEDLLVIGIYEENVSPIMAVLQGQKNYESAYIPFTTSISRDYSFFQLDVFVNEKYSVSAVGDELINYIASSKHRLPENYVFYTAEEDQASVDGLLGGMSLAVAAIAAISLLVGGIGIMNIMLVSVTERTREIGIKKALGARTKDVLFQFLIESAALSAMGGAVGTLLGVGMVILGGSLISLNVVVNPTSIIVAVSFSMVIGIFFGYYPAKKAAKADPIEALRYE